MPTCYQLPEFIKRGNEDYGPCWKETTFWSKPQSPGISLYLMLIEMCFYFSEELFPWSLKVDVLQLRTLQLVHKPSNRIVHFPCKKLVRNIFGIVETFVSRIYVDKQCENYDNVWCTNTLLGLAYKWVMNSFHNTSISSASQQLLPINCHLIQFDLSELMSGIVKGAGFQFLEKPCPYQDS